MASAETEDTAKVHHMVIKFRADRRDLPQYEYAEVPVAHEVVKDNPVWVKVCNLLGEVGWDFIYSEKDVLRDATTFFMKRLRPDPCPFCRGPIERCEPIVRETADEIDKTDRPNACHPRTFWAEVVNSNTVEVHEEQCEDCKATLSDNGEEMSSIHYEGEGLVCVDCELKRVDKRETERLVRKALTATEAFEEPLPTYDKFLVKCMKCMDRGEKPNMLMPGTTKCDCGA